MPFPIPLVLATVIALAIAGIVPVISKARSKIRELHTWFLFGQIRVVVEQGGLPSDQSALLDVLQRSNIDWNSCGMDRGRMYDGWSRPIAVSITHTSLVLRSAGRDGLTDTADDITDRIERR